MTLLECEKISDNDVHAFQGWNLLCLSTGNLWKEDYSSLVSSAAVNNGRINFWATDGNKITAVFLPEGKKNFFLKTCEIVIPSYEIDFIILATWKNETACLWINKQEVASTENEILKDSISIGIKDHVPVEQDFSEKNLAAKIKRRAYLQISDHPHKGRALNKDEVFQQLIVSKSLLEDFLQKMLEGNEIYIGKVAHEIRELIIPSNSELLQRAAAFLDQSLLVYCIPEKKPIFDAVFTLQQNIRLTPHFPSDVCVDVDVWLKLISTYFKGKGYSNEEIIKHIAQAEGSHYSEHVKEIVDEMRKFFFLDKNIVATYLQSLAEVILSLAKKLLDDYEREKVQ